ncbi:hypothetical protein CRU94_03945 [Arcobacter sp. AHV-9/2010]|uniref:hypothetical protein n=1 Tax=Arcobacter sp. AHV-9/2010 TaxID=2021861 RepID=UPI00100B45B9|nr:hypothetical protein [Arcobacter sp. CECT 9299]RXJ95775.1 hypothetical protein CRU94_03945 [Arcobacter sp. CECT 9299]
MQKKLFLSLGLLFTILAFTGCNENTNQSKICIYANEEEVSKCKVGELSFFAPNSWGSERLPLIAVATYCDTNHQIIMNNSGVICRFINKREGIDK